MSLGSHGIVCGEGGTGAVGREKETLSLPPPTLPPSLASNPEIANYLLKKTIIYLRV